MQKGDKCAMLAVDVLSSDGMEGVLLHHLVHLAPLASGAQVRVGTRVVSADEAALAVAGHAAQGPGDRPPRIVPIVADEARTFGMANLFKQVGIYSSVGQRYAPEDIGSVLSYRETLDRQILEEGIGEAGALANWTAAATSYSVHGLAMLPFYIYYSMFGFQRVGDAIWAATDQRSRGFASCSAPRQSKQDLNRQRSRGVTGQRQLQSAAVPGAVQYA